MYRLLVILLCSVEVYGKSGFWVDYTRKTEYVDATNEKEAYLVAALNLENRGIMPEKVLSVRKIKTYIERTDKSMIINDIAEQIEKIQLREHRSVPNILSYVPPNVAENKNKLFRFLSAWNSMGRIPSPSLEV